jgi:RND family efflux transporter MFP subunit
VKKKYVALLISTIIVIFSISFIGSFIKSLVVEADVIGIAPICIDNNIICSGKVEFEEKQNVFADRVCIVKEMLKKEGEFINENDALFAALEVGDVKTTSSNDSLEIPDITEDIKEKIKNSSEIGDLQSFYKKALEKQNNKADTNERNNTCVLSTGETHEINSPCAGILSSVFAKEGQTIFPGSLVATVANPSNLQVALKVSEKQISEIKSGQNVHITGTGFEGMYTGKIKEISNQAQQNFSNTNSEAYINVFASINKTENSPIKPGFTVKCEIVLPEYSNVLIIPYDSVKSDEDGREFVFKYESGKAKKTYIETCKEFNKGFEVCSGISEGDMVVKNPDIVKKEGVTIKVKNILEN